jgi:hypothetical protein
MDTLIHPTSSYSQRGASISSQYRAAAENLTPANKMGDFAIEDSHS